MPLRHGLQQSQSVGQDRARGQPAFIGDDRHVVLGMNLDQHWRLLCRYLHGKSFCLVDAALRASDTLSYNQQNIAEPHQK
ncbi:hypothetical protein D3C85_1463120 [compost metagenome]